MTNFKVETDADGIALVTWDMPGRSMNVLDNTVIVWGNELSLGNSHSHSEIPFLLLGSAGGALKTGRYLQFGSVPHNRLLVSLLQVMGVDASSFGHSDFGKEGPLAGLT